MGHSIQYDVFDEKESKDSIFNRVNAVAVRESDSESGSGLNSYIRFLEDKIYDDEETAYNAIRKLDKGWYDQLAVKFYYYEKRKETKTIINLRENILNKTDDLLEYKQKNSVKNRKSKFIGCPKCNSKINKNYIEDYRWNKCPLCCEDLSSDTLKKTIENKISQIDKMKEQLNNLIKENNQKSKKEIKWLVKTEFHV